MYKNLVRQLALMTLPSGKFAACDAICPHQVYISGPLHFVSRTHMHILRRYQIDVCFTLHTCNSLCFAFSGAYV